MPGTAQGQAGTSRDKAGTVRDKQGHSFSVPACPCLSLSYHACPCLSLSVPVCLCLSLSVPICLYICHTFMSTSEDEYNSLHQNEYSYIDFPCYSHCTMHANLVLNFFFPFHLASSITLSFHLRRSSLLINTWSFSSFFQSIGPLG